MKIKTTALALIVFGFVATEAHALNLGNVLKTNTNTANTTTTVVGNTKQETGANAKMTEYKAYVAKKFNVGGNNFIEGFGDIKALAKYIEAKYGPATWTGSDKNSPEWLLKAEGDAYGNCVTVSYSKQNQTDNFIMGSVGLAKCTLPQFERRGVKPQ